MRLSAKAQTAMETVVEQFKSGDLSPILDIARITLPEDAPSQKWSWRNRVLAYAQSRELDNRGYNQWQEVGRQVVRDTHGVCIWVPIAYKKMVDGEEEERLTFKTATVHPYSHTKEIEPGYAFTYEPREMPPLLDVAKALKVDVRFMPVANALGTCNREGTIITVGSEDILTFFHELAHAAHARISKLKSGQDAKQETIAEFSACVLMHLYGLGDRTGNTWRYIKVYAKDPVEAVSRALVSIGKVISLILEAEGVL